MDAIMYRIIPDETEALAALRAAKIDVISGVSAMDAAAMKKTNPEILQITIPRPQALTVQRPMTNRF